MKSMRPVVVDTNVAVVANGRNTDTSRECQLACAQRLGGLRRHGKIAVDNDWLILNEYKKYLRPAGQPGVGDAFYKWVLTNWRNPSRCVLVPIHPKSGAADDFEEFPIHGGLSDFDPSDKKFVAVSAASQPPADILQAADSRWLGWSKALAECGITVVFLCKDEIREVHQRRTERPRN